MIKKSILCLVGFICGMSHAVFDPYFNPGAGNLRPLYSYQQPSYGQNAYPQQSSYNQTYTSDDSPLTCSRFCCRTLNGFKRCLSNPTSPYRFFEKRPEYAETRQSLRALLKFTKVHPNCYKQFCNRVCSDLPKKFQEVEEPEPQEKKRWYKRKFSKIKSTFLRDDRWKFKEAKKRTIIRNHIKALCASSSEEGGQLRILCSQCRRMDRKMIKSCRVIIKGNKQRPKGRSTPYLGVSRRVFNPVWLKVERAVTRKKGKAEERKKKRRKHQHVREHDEIDDRGSDTSSQSSRSSGSSRSSDSSQGSQSSHVSRLTSDNLSHLDERIMNWDHGVQSSRGESEGSQSIDDDRSSVASDDSWEDKSVSSSGSSSHWERESNGSDTSSVHSDFSDESDF